MLGLLLLLVLLPASMGRHVSYVIGGEAVDTPGKYPWQGSVQLLGLHNCGCSLISSTHVLTAAHCILPASAMTVVLGAHDIYTMQEGSPRRYTASKSIVHPDWDIAGPGFPNDIALIELTEAVDTSTEHVDVIKMVPADASDEDLEECVITGWGLSAWVPPTLPNILQWAPVGLYSTADCADLYEGVDNAVLNDGHVCVGNYNISGGCSGDSGGPTACLYEGDWHVIGVASWVVSTCSPLYPTVYTRVAYYRDWIDQVV